MNTQACCWLRTASIVGALAIALGAFGAHGVPSYLAGQGFEPEAIAKRLVNFETGARYQMFGALFLFGLGLAIDRQPSRAWQVAGWSMLLGLFIFCGALYGVALAPDTLRGTFGRFAPIGGLLQIIAWVAAAVGASFKTNPVSKANPSKQP